MRLTYAEAERLLAGTDRVKLAANTYLVRADYAFEVRLNERALIRILPSGRYVLSSDSWRSQLAKGRLNAFGPVKVYEHRGHWFLEDGSRFVSEMEVGPFAPRGQGVEATGQLTRAT